ncbi:MAG: hypothetical protein FWE62_00175 [Firmicutes bacterium]|nr:hypothetical protein [Bacillota bacterium]
MIYRKRWTGFSAVFLAVALAFGAVSCIRGKKPDFALGAIVKARVENAQYLPDERVLTAGGAGQSVTAVSFGEAPQEQAADLDIEEITVPEIDENGFIEIIDSLGVIDGDSAGKYLGYDIYEVKAELVFLLDKTPVFGQWFRMPLMREREGYAAIPYFEKWAYLINSDDGGRTVDVTRVCWSTRFNYWDFGKWQEVEYYYSSSESIIQYQVMRIKYYFDVVGREVVECYTYSVAVDRVKNYRTHTAENFDEAAQKPLALHYLKNVKDTSLTKYSVVISERYRDLGWDIRGLAPYGTTHNFCELSYDGPDDIRLLKISQILPTQIYTVPAATDISFYHKTGDAVKYYGSTHEYFDRSALSADSYFISLTNNNLTYTEYFDETDRRYISAAELDVVGHFGYGMTLDYWNRSVFSVVHSGEIARSKKFAQNWDNKTFTAMNQTISLLGRNAGMEEVRFVNDAAAARAGGAEYAYEKTLDGFIHDLSAHIVVHSDLKNGWLEIYKGSSKAQKLKNLPGPFDPAELPIGYLRNLADMYYSDGRVSFSADASPVKLDLNMRYSLSLALKSQDGDILILATDDQYPRSVDGSIISNCEYDFSLLDISKPGVYTLQVVLTVQAGGKDVVLFDPDEIAYVHRFARFEIPDTVSNGQTMRYEVSCRARVMQITVTAV